jgi:uncharacterized protein YegL
MTLFFLVDASGSMAMDRIGTVNHAIDEVIPEIRRISVENADARIKIAALEFSNGARWIKNPEPAETFVWQGINASGGTDMGEACRQLAKKLTTESGGFMQEVTGSYAPVIFMLSDGGANDDFEGGMRELEKKGWFNAAIKVAVAIGNGADKAVLTRFTGDAEKVITVHDPQTLGQWIKFLTVTASKVASKSSNNRSNRDGTPAKDATKDQEMAGAIAAQAKAVGGTIDQATGTVNIPPANGPTIW